MIVDVGAGDGASIVRAAANDPATLAIAVDANLAGLGTGFERARRRAVANALFVLAAAEALPRELEAVADEVWVQFPWGSLLAAILSPGEVARGIGRLLAARGQLTVKLSVQPRDGVTGIDRLDAAGAVIVADALATFCGLDVIDVTELSWADTQESGSTWAKRLGVGRGRPGYCLRLQRP